MILPDEKKIRISNTIWQQQTLLHEIDSKEDLKAYAHTSVKMNVDVKRRKDISRHHTATHLLHWALRKVIGEHVHQAGSLVTDHCLRFDFSHFEKLTPEQLLTIEKICNEKILENADVFTDEVDFDKRPKECLAFFEDKYGDRVRVVHVGDYSMELCGGTHVMHLGELGQIKILQESAIASGTRRLEAVTGMAAYEYHKTIEQQHKYLESKFECCCDKIFDKYQHLLEQKKQSDNLYRQMLEKNTSNCVLKQETIKDLNCVQLKIQAVDTNTLRSLSKSYFKQNNVDVLFLAGECDHKGIVIVSCSEKAISTGISAQCLIQTFLKPLGANGGGKPDFATGGIKDIDTLKNAWGNLSFNI